MTGWSRSYLLLTATVGLTLLVAAVLIFPAGAGSRTVTAHFDRAVAVYPGTDLRVMGVRIGQVESVVPSGNSVRVEMSYDPEYKLPADGNAAVVTPTLVADRYVQVFPAYADGAVMPDDGDIPLERTKTPIELDEMYKALDDLSVTLGPKAGSTEGALDNLLTAGAKALEGNGELGSQTIRNLSAASETFARNRGPLFENVRALAELTDTLAVNDSTVETFLRELTSVSGQLEGEREELEQVFASLADVLGIVEGFVKENRKVLGEDVELLSSLLERVDRQKDSVGLVTQKGALALGNLAVAFEPGTGTFGSRVQVQPGLQFRPDQFLCQTLTNSGPPGSDALCPIIETLLTPILNAQSGMSSAAAPPEAEEGAPEAPALPVPEVPDLTDGPPSLLDLLGGEE